MKRIIITATLAIATALAISSCQKDKVKFYDFSIGLDESGFTAGVPSPESYLVTFTNTNTGEITAHLQSSVFKLSKDLIDSIHEEGIVAYTS